MSNLDLWHKVEKTDPTHTKPITGKAYSGNSPKPHWIVLKATETFGPCGLGWGFEIVEEKLLDGALLEPGFYERIHMARVKVWYEWDGRRGTVEHVGQTAFSGRRNNGKPYTDEDAPKKSVTDALIKALSMIGFAGDIFLGRYDDSKYVNELRKEMAEEAAASEQEDERSSSERLADEMIAFISSRPTVERIEKFEASPDYKRDFALLDDDDKARVMRAKNDRKTAIQSGITNLQAG